MNNSTHRVGNVYYSMDTIIIFRKPVPTRFFTWVPDLVPIYSHLHNLILLFYKYFLIVCGFLVCLIVLSGCS